MPRTSDAPTGQVWRLLDDWNSSQPAEYNQTQLAKLFGVSPGLISSWKYMKVRMQPAEQIKIQQVTGISIEQLAAAVAIDEGNGMSENIAARRRKYAQQQDGPAADSIDDDPP